MKVNLKKWGNSHGIRIPEVVINEMNLNENQRFNLTVEEDAIALKVEENQKNLLRQMFKNYDTNQKSEEFDWGEPQGKEVE
ncbi:AbrB/MazE/SpoVT family DNA-binding domain-containing protein [Macrococcus lamae]|uniref:AbrB/MazE/SpoVT family DNA-binding domain-containing protein n=1 Tax=Macrococcus lamae TaxID=198484 RepID=A0A4R6BT23_9STAP|nr:AbrB/MazE/SpoVT family DNA-binding domain-containing protein [Macrococcus lamae]TDM07499.1 AbrB/MazE/SpoVT family DNA-binding domain-containing protein [Macrococcus lamae]